MQGLVHQVDENAPTLATLQTTAQDVLVRLPPGEAKEAIKKELLEIQGKFEELKWKVWCKLSLLSPFGHVLFESSRPNCCFWSSIFDHNLSAMDALRVLGMKWLNALVSCAQAHDAQEAVETELSDREQLGSEVVDAVKFLHGAQDALQADATQLEPAQLESRLQVTKHDIEVRMELVLKRIQAQQEKYADVSEMPTGAWNVTLS